MRRHYRNNMEGNVVLLKFPRPKHSLCMRGFSEPAASVYIMNERRSVDTQANAHIRFFQKLAPLIVDENPISLKRMGNLARRPYRLVNSRKCILVITDRQRERLSCMPNDAKTTAY